MALCFVVAQTVKRLAAMRETQVRSLGREDPLEKEMATHSSTLAWKIPRMEDPKKSTTTVMWAVQVESALDVPALELW